MEGDVDPPHSSHDRHVAVYNGVHHADYPKAYAGTSTIL